MFVHFHAKARHHLTMVTTYAPTDMGEDATKDACYLMLFGYLKEAPTNDKVVGCLGGFQCRAR